MGNNANNAEDRYLFKDSYTLDDLRHGVIPPGELYSTIHDLGRATGDGTWEANYPADMPICYVELSGNLQFFGPPGSGAPQGGGIGTAFLLFDARTGNHFVTGAPARARWA